jgi:beta-lactam-binding protein with PASTA domain
MVDDAGSNIGWFGATSTLKTITVTAGTTTTTVPWVTNLTLAAAGTAITNAGLVVSGVSQEYHATVPSGKIFSQTPGGGVVTNRGSAVALAVSLGPQPTTTTVPWVTNLTVAAAGTAITNAGLVVSSVSQEYHATVAAGKIFSQTPGGGTTVNRGSSVALAASLGPQPQLVKNNSFETNTTNWALSGSAARSTTTHAGSGVASLRINTTNGFASQAVTIVSGKTYDISAYVYIATRTAGQVVFDTGDKYDGAGQGQFVFNATNGGWKKSSGSFTATNTSLTVRMFSEGFAGTAYFDLIDLKPRN